MSGKLRSNASMLLQTKTTDEMRAIKMTYKKGMGKITDIRVFEFPTIYQKISSKGFKKL